MSLFWWLEICQIYFEIERCCEITNFEPFKINRQCNYVLQFIVLIIIKLKFIN